MFATEEETLAGILDYARACFEFADETIDSHPIDAEGRVPWWSADKDEVTLGQIMAHVALDGARHAGHADILRERLDEVVGLPTPGDNVVEWTPERWTASRTRLTHIADTCQGGTAETS